MTSRESDINGIQSTWKMLENRRQCDAGKETCQSVYTFMIRVAPMLLVINISNTRIQNQ